MGVAQKGTAPFTLHNGGNAAAGALQISFTGANATEFTETDNCGTSLAVGTSCTIQVTVTPTDLGTRSAQLVVKASPGGSVSATLSATGDYGYSPLDQTPKWKVFDTTSKVSSAAGLFEGAAFDGQYLYLVPKQGTVARYNTLAAFDNAGSWSTFLITSVSGGVSAFESAAFDKRYVYFVPPYSGIITRYDTQTSFTAQSSWSKFDTGGTGYIGATFDGRYVYFAPFGNSNGTVARYDTQGTFTSASAWATFDATSIDSGASRFVGTVFDGQYLYLVPTTTGMAVRFDTQATFTSAGSWEVFDLANVDTGANGFQGGAFDKRYVYFVPYNNGSYDGLVTRFDTNGTFTNAASWATFDTTTVNANARGFVGAAFDGRYLYLAPYQNSTFDGLVTRFDTTGTFNNAASWDTFDATTIDTGAKGFAGAAFDGRYVYFVPARNGTVTRFDALQPPNMPRLCTDPAPLYCYSGSFF